MRARSEKGASKLTVLVFALITGTGIFAALRILPFFYCYYELQSQMDQMVKVASTLTDIEIRQRLWYQIRHLDIPVNQEDLKLNRENGKIKVWMDYSEVFYVTWKGKDYDLHVFDFHPYAEGPG